MPTWSSQKANRFVLQTRGPERGWSPSTNHRWGGTWPSPGTFMTVPGDNRWPSAGTFVAIPGEFSWPPVGRSRWPLTGHDHGVLRVAFVESDRDFRAVSGDNQGDYVAPAAEDDAVDHDHGDIYLRQV